MLIKKLVMACDVGDRNITFFPCNARRSIVVWSNMELWEGEGRGVRVRTKHLCLLISPEILCFRERFRVFKRHFLPEAGPTSYFLSKASIVGVLEAKFWSCNHVAISVKWVPFGGPPEKNKINDVETSINSNLCGKIKESLLCFYVHTISIEKYLVKSLIYLYL